MPSFGQNIAARRLSAIATVNVAIGRVRAGYITAIPGQEMIYQAKETEAQRYLAEDPPPAALAAYPLMAAEVGITADTAGDLAALWIAMSSQWRAVAAQLETLRLGTIKSINAASSMSDIGSIEAYFLSQIEAL